MRSREETASHGHTGQSEAFEGVLTPRRASDAATVIAKAGRSGGIVLTKLPFAPNARERQSSQEENSVLHHSGGS